MTNDQICKEIASTFSKPFRSKIYLRYANALLWGNMTEEQVWDYWNRRMLHNTTN